MIGTLVKSFDDRSKSLIDVKLYANSCGTDGNSFRDKCNARKLGNASSGTDVNETLFNFNVSKQSSNPKNALSIILSSLLFERSSSDSCGNVVNAASSKRNRRLFDKSNVVNDYQ